MGRLLHISMIIFLGVSFIFCIWFLYRSYKNMIVNGKRLIYQSVNKSTKTDKIGIGEILLYSSMFIIAIIFVIQIIYKGARFPSATAILIRTIILVPIMALFNAKRRTGKALIALFASLLFLLFCTMTYLIIGLPVKAPVLTIDNTEIKLGQTTVQEFMDNGFDVYVEKEHAMWPDHKNFSSSKKFEKCSNTMDISVPKGYHWQAMKIIPNSKGLLTKNNMPIAEVIFHGSMIEKTSLKDCTIIHFTMRDKYISKLKNNKISLKLDGVDLLSKIETDRMKKTFGSKIFRPSQIEKDKHYIISWESNSHHLFYNSYAASIYMDDNFLMNDIELECQIAREADS